MQIITEVNSFPPNNYDKFSGTERRILLCHNILKLWRRLTQLRKLEVLNFIDTNPSSGLDAYQKQILPKYSPNKHYNKF